MADSGFGALWRDGMDRLGKRVGRRTPTPSAAGTVATSRWRRLFRNRSGPPLALLASACLVGVAAGACVFAVHHLVIWAQRAALGFAAENRVAVPDHTAPWRVGAALVVGALLVSLATWLTSRLSDRPPSDAVEANALHGGYLTWEDGVAVVLPILLSVSFGASVGVEAAVTQTGAVLASVLGRRLKLPRSDLRLLVGAGAAAAISAAYQAPIAGMLYAFELVLGTYNKRSLAPVALAAICGFMAVTALDGGPRPFVIRQTASAVWTDYPVSAVIGILAALLGIAVMVLVGGVERALARLTKSETVRRVLGALGLASLAFLAPGILGSGHAAIDEAVNGEIVGRLAVGLLGAKALASALSLGAGFRGGLFSASLFIGALLGQGVAWLSQLLPYVPVANPTLCALVGMAALGACIIGSPLAMAFLVLESTGNYEASLVVALGAVLSSLVTDRLFGYSFATWRFQQRGLALEGGHDISRLTTVSIAELIRPAKFVLPASASLEQVARAVSHAGNKAVAVQDDKGRLLGLVDPALVEVVENEPDLPLAAADLIGTPVVRVSPTATLADVVAIFGQDDRGVLPVVDPQKPDRLIGAIRSRDVFRLSTSVAEQQRREDLGLVARR
ncbi:chloride channel protein [Alsobacter metallidurans]|uniref:Chloride channel protein n=1 Tax=Alsobacter metallidurans TaxID=340221 RepID=A0A917MHF0_9HYPH|nr:chloride channel protein [Alsobacter metallidurans]GGH17395.1 chloride channel protein [Alsobacter metallidurans]